jgi:hypothetical protein
VSPRGAATHPAALWGVLGWLALLSQAIYRLTPLALEPFESGMTELQWGLYVFSIVFMAYSEGYKGFHLQAAPRVISRAMYLARSGRLYERLLAPLFCMSLFRATRKRLIISWCLYAGIVVLVIIVRMLSQPWRGIVDAGVVVGLVLGTASVLYHFVLAAMGKPLVASEVPDE